MQINLFHPVASAPPLLNSIIQFNSIRYFVVIRWALDLFRRINLSTGIFMYVFYVVSALFARAAAKWVRAHAEAQNKKLVPR